MFDKYLFSAKMIRRRKQLRLGIGELAQKLGVNRKTLSLWESPNVEHMPRDIRILDHWCSELGITLSEALEEHTLPDDEFLRDPKHLKGLRIFYSRYMNDEGFARMIHKLHTMDAETLESLNGLMDRLAGLGNKQKVKEMDDNWRSYVDKAQEEGVLPTPHPGGDQ